METKVSNRHRRVFTTEDIMHELLSKMIGHEVDVVCVGSTSLRGKVVNVEDGVLHLKDDENETCFVAIDKIVTVWAKRDRDRHPGFVFKS